MIKRQRDKKFWVLDQVVEHSLKSFVTSNFSAMCLLHSMQNSIQTNLQLTAHKQNQTGSLLFCNYLSLLVRDLLIFLFFSQKTSNTNRCWYRNSIRFPHHWLCQKSIVETTVVLICYLRFRLVWSYGSVLSYDGLLAALRFLKCLTL